MDGMFNSEILKKIIRKNCLDDLSIFLKNYSTFEEIPIISKYSDVLFVDEYIKKKDVSSFLVNIAIFYVNNIKLYARKRLTEKDFLNFFTCITFYDVENDLDDANLIIPNLFVTRKIKIVSFLEKDKRIDLEDFPILKTAFYDCNALSNFNFYKVITDDTYGKICRIYAVPVNH